MSDAFLPFSKPTIDDSDIDAVIAVLKSGWITTGPQNAMLEDAFCKLSGARHAVAMSSATAIIQVYLHALGIGPGDEVITPSMTWVSAGNVITLCGATPIFVDVDRDTLMVCGTDIERAITTRTRLIIPVHFAGAPLDMDTIRPVAEKFGIPVLEDAAHALGCRYKGRPVGSDGDAFFSLQAIKNVTSAEGGVFVTNNDELAKRLRRLKFHGLGMDSFDRSQQGRSQQAEVIEPGFKFNLPDMCAALALSQLNRLKAINSRRAEIADIYRQALSTLPGISPLALPTWQHDHCWHLFVVRLDEQAPLTRDEFIAQMKARNIGCGIHFRAIHQQKYYRENSTREIPSLPGTEWNSARICSLPLFPDMSDGDAERVVSAIHEIFSENHC